MRKILIAVSIALAGCATNPLNAPAPLATSVVDEKALIIALQTFDTTLTAIDELVRAKVIVPGSPRANQIADLIIKAKQAYQAASAAQKAGNTKSYLTALDQAQVVIFNIKSLLEGN